MSSDAPRRAPARWRRWFRRLRITLLLFLLGLVGVLIFLNVVGLPEFIRRPLLQQLRARGLDLQMSTLRWHFHRGVVAENVTFNQTGNAENPRFAAKEVEVNLDYRALRHFTFNVTGVSLNAGKITIPVSDTNRPSRELNIENIRAHLRFLTNDLWSLDDFHAQFGGATFSLNGVITNASEIRNWPLFQPGEIKPERGGAHRLRRFADVLEKIKFAREPEFRVIMTGDGRDPQSFTMHMTLNAPAADTPWGILTNGIFILNVLPAEDSMPSLAEARLHAAVARTPWAEVRALDVEVHLSGAESGTNVVNGELTIQAAGVKTRWASVTNATGTAHWVHSLTNAIPLSGSGELHADSAFTKWAAGTNVSFNATLNTLTNPPTADPAWGAWEKIRPFALGWSARVDALDTEKLGVEEVVCSGNWSAPTLEVTNLIVRFTDGKFAANGKLDVATRDASFDFATDFDAHKISPLLPPVNARWLAKYTWGPPPRFSGSGAVTLPTWTNSAVNWREEIAPTVKLSAFVSATNCAYLGAPADWVQTHITYTNLVWRLPDLVAGRPEGTLELVHEADDRTHEYFFGVRSTISPEALRPLLSTNAQRVLDYFDLSQTPVVNGGVWGRWRHPESVGFTGQVALANFSFRQQTVDKFDSGLRYTNRVLEFLNPHLTRGTQSVVAPLISADFNERRIYFTNCLSTLPPMVVARAIGPQTARALEPYEFHRPPTVRVNGYAPTRNTSDADLRFDVDGGPFAWSVFLIPQISGRVEWRGDSLTLTNIEMVAYGGVAAGGAHFNFAVTPGTEFQFMIATTNVDLHQLMADVSHSNSLEGRMSGLFVVTNANTDDKFTWNGHGDVRLQNGLIWSLPIFGVLSKPLDSIRPGLGSSRFSEGSASFLLTNGVMFSKTLEMRAPTMRLHYDGTVDFAGRVDARVEASLFRDTWVIGPLLSTVLWPMTKLFEYRVTGTLNEPEADPVFIPKLFMHPFQTFEEFLTNPAAKTNSPPFKPPH